MENMDMSQISLAAFFKKANAGQSVKRCLFGPVDHQENSRFIKEQTTVHEEETKAKWNFDFTSMTPLYGKYAWEEVGENARRDIPSAYSMPQLSALSYYRPRTPLGLSSRLNSNIIAKPTPTVFKKQESSCESPLRGEPVPKDLPNVVSSHQSSSKKSAEPSSQPTPAVNSPVKKSSTKRKLTQSDITDYFQSKKHRSAFSSVNAASSKQ